MRLLHTWMLPREVSTPHQPQEGAGLVYRLHKG